ncbi:proteasome adapter and scaffold protein ECM29-like [Watersipora subatra]|uniref:proteasome adapter and scaffold protein ECM29-like n=1 Tax=Watersipora subatra TaxID=2589382 RepID=UPI00355BA337
MSEQEEGALVDRVFFRILATETDESFQASLYKFLPPVLLKMASNHQTVRKKVMEVLQHINKRLKSRPLITLPVTQLFEQYIDGGNPIMVTNFSLVYIKMGYPRLAPTEQVHIIPKILSILPGKPVSQQEMFISLILPSMHNIEFPPDPAKGKELFGLENHPNVRGTLLNYMLAILKMPYSKYYPPPENSPGYASTHLCPPMFSELTYKKVLDMSRDSEYPKAEEVEQLKVGVARYLAADLFPIQEVVLHLILASADTRHTVATLGEDSIRRVSSEVDWEDPEFIKKMATLYLGTATAVNKERHVGGQAKENVVLPAPIRVKAKLFTFLLRSRYAAQIFPQNIQIACDAVAAKETKAKLKKFGLQYIARMGEFGLPNQLKAIAPTLTTTIKGVLDAEESVELKTLAYATLGKLISHVPSLVYDKVDLINELFTRQAKEVDISLKTSIQEAMLVMASSVSKARQDVKEMVEKLLASNIESSDELVRRVCVHYAHYVFHTSWLPTRYLLLLASSDQVPDIRAEAVKLLHTKRQVEMPVAEHSFDLDLYPTFEEMCGYIEKKKDERLRDKKTVSRGSLVLAFKPDTLQQMVKYLRTCLARSCGIKTPHANIVADWLEQAPIISSYKESRAKRAGNDKPPEKQPKSDIEEGERSLRLYAQLLIESVQVHTSADNVYLLLELLSTHRHLAKSLTDKVDWCKGLVNHHDGEVQRYAAGLLAAIITEDSTAAELVQEYIDKFKPSAMKLEQMNGSLYAMGSLISYHNLQHMEDEALQPEETWFKLTSDVVRLLEPQLHDIPKASIAMQVLQQISIAGPLCIEYGSVDDAAEGVTVHSIVQRLCQQVKSSKLDSKQREKVAKCLGTLGVGDRKFPFRKQCLDGLFECSSTKELELHFTLGQALVTSAQGLDCSERRDVWTESEEAYWANHRVDSKYNEILYLQTSILSKYITHVNPHIKQAACVWLLTMVKKCSKFDEVTSRSSEIQSAFMRLLSDNNEITQDIASKGLGLVYDSSGPEQQKLLISNLVGTLMTGQSTEKKSGEVSGETKLFTEGGLGSTPEGQGMSTYRELCAIATDLNQPDLIYKFLHLASHQSMWNSRKGAAFGFSTIAAQAGEQLAPYMSQIVPRLYRYTFDPNIKIQTAMRGIWNAVVAESKPTIDKYLKEILEDLLGNLTNNQWRVRESCCLAVNDLIRGRQLDSVIDQLPDLWHVMLKLLDDIKESTRNAATTAAKTLSKVTIKICDISYGKTGEQALSLILPVLLDEGITSTVAEVRTLSLDTLVLMSKNAGEFLKPHIHTLVPTMLESLSGLEPQSLNYLAQRVGEEAQEKLDKARVAASKMSPMMDSINLCIRQVDESVLPTLIPRLIELIKSSIGLGTKVGIASVLSSLCLHVGLQAMQPFTGKCMAALCNALSDRNNTVRKHYCNCLASLCKLAKDSSVEKLIEKLRGWYMDKEDESKGDVCGQVLKSMTDICPDTVNKHKTLVLPLVFLAMHRYEKPSADGGRSPSVSATDNQWKDIWNEVAIGTDSAVRLYIAEFLEITDTALQSSSWLMKAQAAAAMGTIAKSAGDNMDGKHLSTLVSALLSGLAGRTWQGKEVLLTALSDVVRTCHSSILSSEINVDDIIKCCIREANKESIKYKIPAVTCLGQVLYSLQVDRYKDVYNIILPYVMIDKHEDDDISDQVLIQMRETGFEALGKAWPKELSTHEECVVDTTRLLLLRLPQVTWKEQLSIWNSMHAVMERSSLSEIKSTESSPWSLSAFTEQLLNMAIMSARESKYSSVREAAYGCMKLSLQSIKGCDGVLSEKTKVQLTECMTDAGMADSSLEVKKLAEEIQQMLC